MATFTKTYHRTIYPSIDPLNPANSQAGRTVLVTGASEGIGLSIARAFVAAGAGRVIVLGRRQAAVEAAVSSLRQAASAPRSTGGPAEATTTTRIEGLCCDISSGSDASRLWGGLSAEGTHVDVLVLNAAFFTFRDLGPGGDDSLSVMWKTFEVGVLANMRFVHAFMNQKPAEGSKAEVIINISSFSAHAGPLPGQGAYGATKAAFVKMMQHLAEENPSDKVQIVSVHPGAILTPGARREGGLDETSLPWDDASLPGAFTVWASTPAARFLHGAFVWANWDVDELVARKEEIATTPGMLRIGMEGVKYVNTRTIFQEILAKTEGV